MHTQSTGTLFTSLGILKPCDRIGKMDIHLGCRPDPEKTPATISPRRLFAAHGNRRATLLIPITADRISHPWPVPPCPVVIGFEGVGAWSRA